jgi:uncharacterized protein (DUF1810 family)
MSLFQAISEEPIFSEVLQTFFDGKPDQLTLSRLQKTA